MKLILSTFAFMVLLVLGAFGWNLVEAGYRDWQRQEIVADIEYDDRLCPQRQPLLVEIQNDSNLAIEKVRFDIDGYDASSGASVRSTRFGVTVRRIIVSDGQTALCFRVPDESSVIETSEFGAETPHELIWHVAITSVEFL